MTSGKFSEKADQALMRVYPFPWSYREYNYAFENFFHPLIGKLIGKLNQASGDPIEAMLDPAFLNKITTAFFATEYTVNPAPSIEVTSRPKAIDLDHYLPYACY